MRAFCRALIALNVLYCLASLFADGLPGWKMFDSAERLDATLVDGTGRPVDVTARLPRGAYFTERRELDAVARWICAHEPAGRPYFLVDPHGRTPIDCDAR